MRPCEGLLVALWLQLVLYIECCMGPCRDEMPKVYDQLKQVGLLSCLGMGWRHCTQVG